MILKKKIQLNLNDQFGKKNLNFSSLFFIIIIIKTTFHWGLFFVFILSPFLFTSLKKERARKRARNSKTGFRPVSVDENYSYPFVCTFIMYELFRNRLQYVAYKMYVLLLNCSVTAFYILKNIYRI